MPEDRFPSMGYWARATAAVLGTVAVLLAAWRVRGILLLVLVAVVLAVGLDPQVRWLQHRHVARGWAVTLIVLLTVAFLAVFAWLVIPPAVGQFHELATNTPRYIARLRNAKGLLGTLEARYHLSARVSETVARLPDLALGRIPSITAGAGSILFNALTVAVLTIYFLLGLEHGRATAKTLGAPEHAERTAAIVDESIERIGGYVSGNIFISVIAGILAYIVLRIVGVPFAAALALWVAIADLIPNIGATLGAIACVFVALFTSVAAGIITAVWFILYQRFENYLILPRVMTRAIDLSAPTTIIALLVGSSLAGLPGALLALPVAATMKVVIRKLWLEEPTTAIEPAEAALPE
jgi:predicted PurR-regulated permease PerM